MISEEYINVLLEQWSKLPDGRKQIADFRQSAFEGKTGGSATDGAYMTKAQMRNHGKRMKEILFKHIVAVIPSFYEEAIIVHSPKETTDGNYQLDISFDTKALHRDSLFDDYDSLYSGGLENIVTLFTYGYSAEHHVYGWWKPGRVKRPCVADLTIKSKLKREPNSFLRDAVDEFNSIAIKNVLVTLAPKYENKTEEKK